MSDLEAGTETNTHFHQLGDGADGSMAGAFFAGQDIKMMCVNPIASASPSVGMNAGVTNQQRFNT